MDEAGSNALGRLEPRDAGRFGAGSERADVARERAMPAAAVGATPSPMRRHIASNTATSCSG
jgi:hypothetical protein